MRFELGDLVCIAANCLRCGLTRDLSDEESIRREMTKTTEQAIYVTTTRPCQCGSSRVAVKVSASAAE